MSARWTLDQLQALFMREWTRSSRDLRSCLTVVHDAITAKPKAAKRIRSKRVTPVWRVVEIRKAAEPVLSAVRLRFGLPRTALTGPLQVKSISWPRFVAMWLLRVGDTGREPMTFEDIGVAVQRDHSSVINGIREVERRRAADPVLAADLDGIRESLRGAAAPVAERERGAA